LFLHNKGYDFYRIGGLLISEINLLVHEENKQFKKQEQEIRRQKRLRKK